MSEYEIEPLRHPQSDPGLITKALEERRIRLVGKLELLFPSEFPEGFDPTGAIDPVLPIAVRRTSLLAPPIGPQPAYQEYLDHELGEITDPLTEITPDEAVAGSSEASLARPRVGEAAVRLTVHLGLGQQQGARRLVLDVHRQPVVKDKVSSMTIKRMAYDATGRLVETRQFTTAGPVRFRESRHAALSLRQVITDLREAHGRLLRVTGQHPVSPWKDRYERLRRWAWNYGDYQDEAFKRRGQHP